MTTELERFGARFFIWPKEQTVLEWAEENVELSPRITEQPGPFSTRLHPYCNEILEGIANPRIKRISLCWGSQTSKTTTFYVMLGHVIDQDPKAILWVFPNLSLCKTFSSERWMPFCRESKALVKHLPRYIDNTIDADRFTLTKQEFSRCTMNLVGAGSSANVRSYPVSVLVLDEIDVIDERTRRECMDRVKGRHDYKVLQSSTPVTEAGGIWQEFQEGDRRRYYMPCPHCQAKIIFRLKNAEGDLNLKWDNKANLSESEHDLQVVESSTVYICEECRGEITNAHKSKMLRDGNWNATSSSSESGVRSYHLNSIYSPILTFGRLAVEYLKARTNPGAMQAYECAYGICDTAYRTQEIYEEIHARRPFWFGARGWERLPHPYKMTGVDPFSPMKDKKFSKKSINILNVNKDVWQGELLKRRNGTNLNWFTYKETDSEYIRQMLSTNQKEKVDRKGKVKFEWVVEGHRQDHYWDCETYILTLSHVFGLGGAVIRTGKDLAKTSKARPSRPSRPSKSSKKSIW